MKCSRRIGWRAAVAGALFSLAGCGPDQGRDPAALASAAAVRRGTVIRVEPAMPLPTEGFGQAVAVTRDTLAVTDFLGFDRVHVHTYALAGGAAVETGRLVPASRLDACFGQALDLRGDLLAVGVPCADGGAGAVELFGRERALGAWQPVATLRAPAAGVAAFGTSVALGNDELAVGAPHAAGGGAVYLYGPSLALEAVLAEPDGAPWDLFGQALSLAGGTLAVAAPARPAEDALAASGRVTVFRRAGRAWQESAELVVRTSWPGEESGWAVAAGNGVVAVSGDRFVSHSLHVFEAGPAGWVEQDLDEAERGAPDCGFVEELALDGGLLAAGMSTLDGPAGEYRAGGVRLYGRSPEGWVRLADVRTGVEGDKVGHALDLAGGLLAIGAPGTFLRNADGTFVNRGSGAVLVLRP